MSSFVAIAPRTGLDVQGAATYSTSPATYQAHIARKVQMVRTSTGQERVSMQALYLMTRTLVTPDAQVTLSTADAGSTEASAVHPPIVAVEPRYDGNGLHHVVVYL